jgi:UDP-N-acetylglucosamine--N-acetylmuramyl-(pentapeptide) pyrophosphoryl-undecaprenol N-acetylglucosamine transferase
MMDVLIVCGGTGGHLSPGIAVAEELRRKGHQCRLLISQKQVDSALVQKYPHLEFIKVPGRAFSGGLFARIRSLYALFQSILYARALLKADRPDVALLFGGFLSLGLGLAARWTRLPFVLHEANSVPGKTTRVLKRMATRVYLPEGIRLPHVALNRIRYFGYPVRSDIQPLSKVEARQRLGIECSGKLLAIVGGSQGAMALNTWVSEHFEALAQHGIAVYCVTGLGKSDPQLMRSVDAAGREVCAKFVPFTEQMEAVISAADLVLSRAGAGSIAELIRCCKPAVLVPYPHAADDHQQGNAAMHQQLGAGIVVEEAAFATLLDEVLGLIYNDWLLNTFRKNLLALDRFDSSQMIADDLLQLAHCHYES